VLSRAPGWSEEAAGAPAGPRENCELGRQRPSRRSLRNARQGRRARQPGIPVSRNVNSLEEPAQRCPGATGTHHGNLFAVALRRDRHGL
jgi:hypothetical protein